jgi:hypothetical protein
MLMRMTLGCPVGPGMTVMVGIAYVGRELSDFDIIRKRFAVYL